MTDLTPFFRLAALLLASVEIGRLHTPSKEEAILARAEKYAAFINQGSKP